MKKCKFLNASLGTKATASPGRNYGQKKKNYDGYKSGKRGIYHVFIYLDLTSRYIKVAKGVYKSGKMGIYRLCNRHKMVICEGVNILKDIKDIDKERRFIKRWLINSNTFYLLQKHLLSSIKHYFSMIFHRYKVSENFYKAP